MHSALCGGSPQAGAGTAADFAPSVRGEAAGPGDSWGSGREAVRFGAQFFGQRTMDYFFVLLFVFLSGAFVAGGLTVSRLLAPHDPSGIKHTPYECGVRPIGSAWVQFNVGYYLFACCSWSST
jgi:hypothetical protein